MTEKSAAGAHWADERSVAEQSSAELAMLSVAPTSPVSPAHLARPSPRRRVRRRWLVSVIVLLVVFLISSAVLFVWPRSARIRPVGAVLELNGPSGRETTRKAVALVEAGVAPVLLLSVASYKYSSCPSVPHVRVVCFVPQPNRTVGEIDFAEKFAQQEGISSILIVAGHSQTTRARYLARRCFSGASYVVAGPMSWRQIPYSVVYEWGAMFKAAVLDRGCH